MAKEKSVNKKENNRKIMGVVIDYSPLIILAIIMIANCLFTPNFAKYTTMSNIIIQVAPTMLIALGMTWTIAAGGIDISVGSVMAVASMVSVKMIEYGAVPAIICGLGVSIVSGIAVGLIISKFSIQPIIVTLTFMIGLRGVAQIMNDSKILRFKDDTYAAIGRTKIADNIPIQLIIMIVAVFIIWIITTKTSFGRRIEAVGDNLKASFLSGINTVFVTIGIYATTAFLAGCSGILSTARLGASDANTLGLAIEMDAIAAVAIGGTCMTGGKPNIMGTVVGALIMQVMTIMVNMNNIPYEYSLVFKAIIIVVALYGQRMLQKIREGMN